MTDAPSKLPKRNVGSLFLGVRHKVTSARHQLARCSQTMQWCHSSSRFISMLMNPPEAFRSIFGAAGSVILQDGYKPSGILRALKAVRSRTIVSTKIRGRVTVNIASIPRARTFSFRITVLGCPERVAYMDWSQKTLPHMQVR